MDLFSHVGVVVHDVDAALAVWRDALGLRIVESFTVPEEQVRCIVLSASGAYGEATCVELIEPLDPADHSHPISRRLAEHGEGVFHLAFRTGDREPLLRRLSAAAVEHVELPPAGGESSPRVVVHPAAANGVLVEVLGAAP